MLLDKEGKGYITTEEFKDKIGKKFIKSNPYIIKFLAVVEKENEGKIEKDDFENIFDQIELA